MTLRSFLCVILPLLLVVACHESRSPTDPTGPGVPVVPPAPTSIALFGEVTSATDRMPLAGVHIEASGAGPATISDTRGQFRLVGLLPNVVYKIVLSKEGFLDTVTAEVLGTISSEVRRDFVMARDPGGVSERSELSGITWVKNQESHSAYTDATVEIVDGPQARLSVMSDEMGMYLFFGLVPGTIQVRASRGGVSQTRTITLSPGQNQLDFAF